MTNLDPEATELFRQAKAYVALAAQSLSVGVEIKSPNSTAGKRSELIELVRQHNDWLKKLPRDTQSIFQNGYRWTIHYLFPDLTDVECDQLEKLNLLADTIRMDEAAFRSEQDRFEAEKIKDRIEQGRAKLTEITRYFDSIESRLSGPQISILQSGFFSPDSPPVPDLQ